MILIRNKDISHILLEHLQQLKEGEMHFIKIVFKRLNK